MKTTARKILKTVFVLLLITLVTAFVSSCDKTEEETDEKGWLSVSEQLAMSHMSKEEALYEDEIASTSDSEAADTTKAVETVFETKAATKETVVAQEKEQKNIITYVLNTNSKKFHEPDCSGLPTKNRRDFYGTRDEAIDAGYEPCGRCKP